MRAVQRSADDAKANSTISRKSQVHIVAKFGKVPVFHSNLPLNLEMIRTEPDAPATEN